MSELEVRTDYLEATLGLVKRLEISKELIHKCVTVPGCCCCMPLLHNHLMDSCSYVRKNILLAANTRNKGKIEHINFDQRGNLTH